MSQINDGPKCSQPLDGVYAAAAAAAASGKGSTVGSAGTIDPVGCSAFETYALVVSRLKPDTAMGG